MPIYDHGNDIVIMHKVPSAANMAATIGLGDLSVELAVWMHAKMQEQKWREQGTPEEILRGKDAFLQQPQNIGLRDRSIIAGARGYKPTLATPDGDITPVGLRVASRALPIIEEINNETDNLAWNPQDWLNAEDMFIQARVPLKVAKLLKLFYLAIQTTERQFQDEQLASQPDLDKFNIPGINMFTNRSTDKEPIAPQITQTQAIKGFDPDTPPKREFGPIGPIEPKSIFDTKQELTTPTQIVTAEHTLMFQTSLAEGHKWQAWVPVSIFHPNTRYDVKYLYRFGLIDLRTFATAGRGRPRLIIRPSVIGEKLTKDFGKMNLI